MSMCIVCARDLPLAVDGLCSAACRKHVRRLDLKLHPSDSLPAGWYEPSYDHPSAGWPMPPAAVIEHSKRVNAALQSLTGLKKAVDACRMERDKAITTRDVLLTDAKVKKAALADPDLHEHVTDDAKVVVKNDRVLTDDDVKRLDKLLKDYKKAVKVEDMEAAEADLNAKSDQLATAEWHLLEAEQWAAKPLLIVAEQGKPRKEE